MSEEEVVGTEIPGEISPDIEEKARSMGWVAEDEFKGDKSKWRPADEFVERGENILPIVKKRLKTMTDELTAMQRESAESRQAMEEMRTFFERSAQNKAKEGYQQALADITTQQRAAVGDMDQDRYDALEKAKGQLYNQFRTAINQNTIPQKPKVPVFTKRQTEEAQAFIARNGWFNQNPAMNQYAMQRSSELTSPVGDVDYEQLEKDVRAKFPNEFTPATNPNRDKETTVEGGTTQQRTSGKKTFDNLPQSAKEAYARFAKQLPNFTKADYLKDYQWD